MRKNILLILIVAAQLSSMTACQTDSTQTETTTTTVETETAAETFNSDVPSFERKDFDGTEFHVAAPVNPYGNGLYFADGENGDVMNDALYSRSRMLEEALNVSFTYELLTHSNGGINLLPVLQKSVMAGDDAYQMVLTHPMASVASLVTEGLLYDWQDIPYVDFSKPYWNSECNEALAVGDHQYYAVSDYMLVDAYGIYFNKSLIEQYDLESPYTLVRNNQWTLDKMMEMANAATADLNGDSVMDHNDQYGFSTLADWPLAQMIYASGLRLCTPQTYEFSLMNDRMVTLVEKMHQLINESGSTYTWKTSQESMPGMKMDITSGRTLFNIFKIESLMTYRDSDVEIGVVPAPMLDETQTECVGLNWSGLMCVPRSISDPELVGMAAELLSYYSTETTVPAYYDVLLGQKLAQDEDMCEMLAYIFDHVVFDSGCNYFGQNDVMSQMFYVIPNLVCGQKSMDFVSYYDKREAACEKLINDFLDEIQSIED